MKTSGAGKEDHKLPPIDCQSHPLAANYCFDAEPFNDENHKKENTSKILKYCELSSCENVGSENCHEMKIK